MRSVSVIEDLRSRIARIEGGGRPQRRLAFGVAEIDGRLPGGGLLTGALHEVAGSPELCDDAAATVFLAGILARLDGPVFWCLRWRDLFAPALGLAGLHPDRVIHVEAGSDANVLLAMEECLRHGGLAAVVGEVARVSTTPTKRLQLAAEGSGVTALLFRRGERPQAGGDGSAAITRWRVRAAPSRPLGLPSLDRARWHLHLERARGGEAHHWTVEACDAQGRLALPADVADRPAAQGEYQVAV